MANSFPLSLKHSKSWKKPAKNIGMPTDSSTMSSATASTAKLEAFFFTCLSLTIIGACYRLTSPLFALCQATVSFALLWLLWPKGEILLFSATRSTCAKYKAMFLELCALVYIVGAVLSVLARIRAKDYKCDIMLVLLREQAITTISVLDLAASFAIVAAHVTGRHDICNRIHSRFLRIIRSLHKIGWSAGRVCYHLLQEQPIDLERQSEMALAPPIDPKTPVDTSISTFPAGTGQATSEMGPQETQGVHEIEEMDDPDGAKLRERFRHLKRLSMKNNPHKLVHEELRSISARLRWSSLRYCLGFQERPFEDVFFVVPSQVPTISSPIANLQLPHLELSPGKARSLRSHSPSLRSEVTNMIDHQNALGIHQLQPFDSNFHLNTSISKAGSSPDPIFQLPGEIQNICVKALPDTGSSQNVIDKSLVQQLSPPIPIIAVDDLADKPLVAPDGKPIPSAGKVRLPWMFKKEDEVYERWFYVVENCSKGVIIGNAFLRETETMNKHRDRLMITRPSDPNSLPGNLASEAQQQDCLRQLVLGRINDMDTFASIDTGCEANLMSADYADALALEVQPLPSEKKEVEFANGRRSTVLGQVDVNWSFFDTPDEATPVTCYVLRTCIHPVIFGERFVYSEDPWINHETSLSQVPSNREEMGVVGLEKARRFWFFGNYKPDPKEEKRHREKRARKDRAETRLRSQSQPQPQSQSQTQPQVPPQTQQQTSPAPAAITPPAPAHTSHRNNAPPRPPHGTTPSPRQTRPTSSSGTSVPPATSTTSLLPSHSQPRTIGATAASQPRLQQPVGGPSITPNAFQPPPPFVSRP